VVAAAVTLAAWWASPATLRVAGGVIIFAFVAFKTATRWRHPKWVGMRVDGRQLAAWSFVMSSAHGAGLMLLPILPRVDGWHASAAVIVHTVALSAVTGAAALIVYHTAGVGFLRRAWVNLDFVWIGALVVAGVVTLLG
jgi:hypothetical protein